MGLVEILPHLPHLLKRIKQTVQDIIHHQPSILVTIDSPGFCHRVAKAVKKKLPNLRIVHYVAPSVWAWRPERAKKLANLVDHLLTLFPFEPPYFLKHNLPTTFVGHPLLEQLFQPDPSFRQRHQIPENSPLLTLLAGSRKGEIDRLLPVFSQAAKTLSQSIPNLHIVSPILPLYKQRIHDVLSKVGLSYTIVTSPEEKYAAFYNSQVALAASGTVTLELAMTGLPMVIGYKLSPLTYYLAKHLVKIKNVCLVNILLGKPIVPEFLQKDCTASNLAKALSHLLTDKDQLQKMALSQAIALLQNPEKISPSEKAANIILEML